jgi:hypothetical protein
MSAFGFSFVVALELRGGLNPPHLGQPSAPRCCQNFRDCQREPHA